MVPKGFFLLIVAYSTNKKRKTKAKHKIDYDPYKLCTYSPT